MLDLFLEDPEEMRKHQELADKITSTKRTYLKKIKLNHSTSDEIIELFSEEHNGPHMFPGAMAMMNGCVSMEAKKETRILNMRMNENFVIVMIEEVTQTIEGSE